MSIHKYSIIIELMCDYVWIVAQCIQKEPLHYINKMSKRLLQLYLMQDKLTTSKIINSWNILYTVIELFFLIGYSHTGRTTYSELNQKYVFNNANPNLAYDNGKYNLEGVISNKSFKVQTVFPAVCGSPNDKQGLKLVDVPSLVLAPDSKKWSNLQQKITVQYMMSKAKKAGFLIFVDEKNTRSNTTNWKKTINSFLELFKIQTFTDEFINSIAFVFTKIPTEINYATMVNRLKAIQTSIKSQNPALTDKIFKSIIDNNRILLFKKASGDKTEEQQFIENWRKIEKLDNYVCRKQNIKEIFWSKEGKQQLLQYLKNTQESLKYIANTTKLLLQLEQYNPNSISDCKKNRLASIKDISICSQVKRKLLQDKKGPSYISLVQQYISLANQYPKINTSNIKQFIEGFIKFNFYSDLQDLPIFQTIFEGLQFLQLTKFQPFSLSQSINCFKQIFSETTKQKVLLKLAKADQGNQKKDFYQFAIKTITQFFAVIPASLGDFVDKCKKKLISFANPRQALKMYVSQLVKQKNGEKRFNLAQDIGLVIEAGRVFKASNNVWGALSCFKDAAVSNQHNAKEYINYLIDIRLYQQARSACYQFAAKFGFSSRSKFQQSITKIDESFKKYIGQKRKLVILQDISNAGIEQINKIVNELLQKI